MEKEIRANWVVVGREQVSLETAQAVYGRAYGAGNEFIAMLGGRYAPRGLSFLIPRVWEKVKSCCRSERILAPTEMYDCRLNQEAIETIVKQGFDFSEFGASYTELLPGTFWRSRKGGACFRPTKDLKKATYWLLKIQWNAPRGSGEYHRDLGQSLGAEYFYSASSQGGGFGFDWVIIPKK